MNTITLIFAALCGCWIGALPFLLFFIVKNMTITAKLLKEMRRHGNVR